MDLPVAFALLAILVAFFALVAVGGVYFRLRQVEQLMADLTFGGQTQALPVSLRPRPNESAAVLLTLDGECSTCHHLVETVEAEAVAGKWAGLRVVRVFSSADARDQHRYSDVMESVTDPDAWAAAYEGYTPTISVVDRTGRTVYRRFVYADTNLSQLLAEVHATGIMQGNQASSREAR